MPHLANWAERAVGTTPIWFSSPIELSSAFPGINVNEIDGPGRQRRGDPHGTVFEHDLGAVRVLQRAVYSQYLII